jgi:hypothetical protein
MKRALFASILGIATSVTASYGQGHVLFSTYWSSTSIVSIQYPAGGGGKPADTNFTAELYYGLGSGVPFASMTALPSSITPVGTQLPGVINGPAVDIPNYVSGPITFEFVVSSSLIFGTAGNSPSWTEPSIATGLSAPNVFTYSLVTGAFPSNPYVVDEGLLQFSFIPVPEPGMLAFGSLGGLIYLIKRRSRQSGGTL